MDTSTGRKTPNLAALERLLGACEHDVEVLARPRVRRGAASLAEARADGQEDPSRVEGECAATAVRVRRRLRGSSRPGGSRSCGTSRRPQATRASTLRWRASQSCSRPRAQSPPLRGSTDRALRRAVVVRRQPSGVQRVHARQHAGGARTSRRVHGTRGLRSCLSDTSLKATILARLKRSARKSPARAYAVRSSSSAAQQWRLPGRDRPRCFESRNCWILSLTPRVLLKAPWMRGLSSSSDSDRNRCQVEGGAGGQLSRNRRRCSA